MKTKFYYEIEETRTFNKPTVYRLTYFYYRNFLFNKYKFTPQSKYVDESNFSCYEKDAFKTESKQEIEKFMQFCIDDDNK